MSLPKILLIDDEPMLLTALRRVLSRDYDVVATTDARDALASITAGERFDAIVCDLMMPNMTGMEFHAAVARIAPELLPALLFITGEVLSPDASEQLEGVPNAILRKPFALAAVREALAAVVSRRKTSAGAAA